MLIPLTFHNRVYARKGLVPRASHSGDIALAGSCRLRSTLVAARILVAHAVLRYVLLIFVFVRLQVPTNRVFEMNGIRKTQLRHGGPGAIAMPRGGGAQAKTAPAPAAAAADSDDEPLVTSTIAADDI